MYAANTFIPDQDDLYTAANVPPFLSNFIKMNAATGTLQYKTGSGQQDVIPGKTFFFADFTKPGLDVNNPDCYVNVLPEEGDSPTGNVRLVAIP